MPIYLVTTNPGCRGGVWERGQGGKECEGASFQGVKDELQAAKSHNLIEALSWFELLLNVLCFHILRKVYYDKSMTALLVGQ